MERIESDSDQESEVDVVKEDTRYIMKIVDIKTLLFEYVLKKGKQIKMRSWVKIIAHKGGKVVMEIQQEKDGTVLLENL